VFSLVTSYRGYELYHVNLEKLNAAIQAEGGLYPPPMPQLADGILVKGSSADIFAWGSGELHPLVVPSRQDDTQYDYGRSPNDAVDLDTGQSDDQMIITLPDNVLAGQARGADILSDGVLLRGAVGGVYAWRDGAMHAVPTYPSPSGMQSGFQVSPTQWINRISVDVLQTTVVVLPESLLGRLPRGEDIKVPLSMLSSHARSAEDLSDGMLIRDTAGGNVYLWRSGSLHLIPSRRRPEGMQGAYEVAPDLWIDLGRLGRVQSPATSLPDSVFAGLPRGDDIPEP
jgi:hypothetical protein